MFILRSIKKLLVRVGYHSKPDFMILGAAKAGTTALFHILNQHSLLRSASPKEVYFFSRESWYSPKNLPQYHEHFPLPIQISRKIKLFEATPSYLSHPYVAQRLHQYQPDLKLIVMLRNPEQRAFSHWTMRHHLFGQRIDSPLGMESPGPDPRSFTEAIGEDMLNLETSTYPNDQFSYVKRGIYCDQILTYLQYFDRSQMLFVESDALLKRFEETVPQILSFLGVPYESLRLSVANTAAKNEKAKYEQDIQDLRKFYKPHNERLYSLLGRKLESF